MPLPWSPAPTAAPLSRDTTAMAVPLTGVPAPTYPTPQESHSLGSCSHMSHSSGPCSHVCSWGFCSHRCPAPQGSHSLGILFPQGLTPTGALLPWGSLHIRVHVSVLSCCMSMLAVLLFIACTNPAHLSPYVPALLTHICAPMCRLSVCPCRLRMLCVRCQPAC